MNIELKLFESFMKEWISEKFNYEMTIINRYTVNGGIPCERQIN